MQITAAFSRGVKDYADSIAHLQKGDIRSRGTALRGLLEEARAIVHALHEILVRAAPPDLKEERFINGLEIEVRRRFLAAEAQGLEPR